MGQRTQVILRIQDEETGLKSIGVYHNQWGYGFNLFTDVTDIMKSLQNIDNYNKKYLKGLSYTCDNFNDNTHGLIKKLPSGAFLEYFVDIGCEKTRKNFKYCDINFNSKKLFNRAMYEKINAKYFHRRKIDNNDGGVIIDIALKENSLNTFDVYFFKRTDIDDGYLIEQCTPIEYIKKHSYYKDMSEERKINITKSYETIITSYYEYEIK